MNVIGRLRGQGSPKASSTTEKKEKVPPSIGLEVEEEKGAATCENDAAGNIGELGNEEEYEDEDKDDEEEEEGWSSAPSESLQNTQDLYSSDEEGHEETEDEMKSEKPKRTWSAPSPRFKIPSSPFSQLRRTNSKHQAGESDSLPKDHPTDKKPSWSPKIKIPASPLSRLAKKPSSKPNHEVSHQSNTAEVGPVEKTKTGMRTRTWSGSSLFSSFGRKSSKKSKDKAPEEQQVDDLGHGEDINRQDEHASVASGETLQKKRSGIFRFWGSGSSSGKSSSSNRPRTRSAELPPATPTAVSTETPRRTQRTFSVGSLFSWRRSKKDKEERKRSEQDLDGQAKQVRAEEEDGGEDNHDAVTLSSEDDEDEDRGIDTDASSFATEGYDDEAFIRVKAFYILHNPDKLDTLEDVMDKYRGNEDVMMERLEKKYNHRMPGKEDAEQIIHLYELEQEAKEMEPQKETLENVPAAANVDSRKPYGKVESITIKIHPKPLLGIIYSTNDRPLIMELDKTFLQTNRVDVTLRTLKIAHWRYLHGIPDKVLLEKLEMLKEGCVNQAHQQRRASKSPLTALQKRSNEPTVKNAKRATRQSFVFESLPNVYDEDFRREKAHETSQVREKVDKLEDRIQEENERQGAGDWLWEGRMDERDEGDEEVEEENGEETDESNYDDELKLETREQDDEPKRILTPPPVPTMEEYETGRNSPPPVPTLEAYEAGRNSPPSVPTMEEYESEREQKSPSPVSATKESEVHSPPPVPTMEEYEKEKNTSLPRAVEENETENQESPHEFDLESPHEFDLESNPGQEEEEEEEEEEEIHEQQSADRNEPHPDTVFRDRLDGERKRDWKARLALIDQAIYEVVDSERKYYNDLAVIGDGVVSKVATAIKSKSIRLTHSNGSQFQKLLGLWSKLARFHSDFSQTMWKECVDESRHGRVAAPLRISWYPHDQPLYKLLELMKRLRQVSSVYDDYCLLYNEAISCLVVETSKKGDLTEFLKRNCEGALRGNSLESYLIKPVQRLCKYPLLLDAIENKLTRGSSEAIDFARNKVEETKQDLQEIVQRINRHKLQAEKLSEMAEIHKRLRFGSDEEWLTLSEPFRILLLSGSLYVSGVQNGVEVAGVKFVLLYNDVVVICTPRKSLFGAGSKVYDVCHVLHLPDAELADAQGLPPDAKTAGMSFGWVLSATPWESDWTLSARSEEERRQWLQETQEALAFASHDVYQTRDQSLIKALIQQVNDPSASKKSNATAAQKKSSSKMRTMFGALHDTSATLIQKTYRGILGRRKAQEEKERIIKEIEAALIIQRGFRRLRKRMYWKKQRALELSHRANLPAFEDDEDDEEEEDLHEGRQFITDDFEEENDAHLEDYEDFDIDRDSTAQIHQRLSSPAQNSEEQYVDDDAEEEEEEEEGDEFEDSSAQDESYDDQEQSEEHYDESDGAGQEEYEQDDSSSAYISEVDQDVQEEELDSYEEFDKAVGYSV